MALRNLCVLERQEGERNFGKRNRHLWRFHPFSKGYWCKFVSGKYLKIIQMKFPKKMSGHLRTGKQIQMRVGENHPKRVVNEKWKSQED